MHYAYIHHDLAATGLIGVDFIEKKKKNYKGISPFYCSLKVCAMTKMCIFSSLHYASTISVPQFHDSIYLVLHLLCVSYDKILK